MRKIFWIVLLMMFQTSMAEQTKSKQIRIVSTANVHGETDPCG